MPRLSLIRGGLILIVLGILVFFGMFMTFFMIFDIHTYLTLMTIQTVLWFIGHSLFWGGIFLTIIGVVKRMFPERVPFLSSPHGTPESSVLQISSTERAVIEYVKKHGYQIRLSECAKELSTTIQEVEEAINSLEKKHILVRPSLSNEGT